MEDRARLTRALLWVVLVAALATAPVFLFAEELDREHALRVLTSNGVCALLCVVLLVALKRGHVDGVARSLVFGLLMLVTALAWTNGEPVHVNVVNFVLVTVLASALLGRGALVLVALLAAAAMTAIAWRKPGGPLGEELTERRFEAIVQFLPTYGVIVLVLWLSRRERPAAGP